MINTNDVNEVRQDGRVIGYVATNENDELFARTPGHGWERIDLQVAAGKSSQEASDALHYALTAQFYSEAGYL